MRLFFLALLFAGTSQGMQAQITPVTMTPAATSTQVPPGTSISFSFPLPMDTFDAQLDSVYVWGLRSGVRANAVYSGAGSNQITVVPSRDFLPGEHVVATLSRQVNTQSGTYFPFNSFQNRMFTIATSGGAGTFVLDTSFGMGTGNGGIAVADFNGDGRDDLMHLTGSTTATTRTFQPGAGWGFLAPGFSSGQQVRDFQAGDIDKDGDVDIMVASQSNLQGFLNNGSGVMTPGSIVYNAQGIERIVIFDWDGDGDLDVTGSHTVTTSYRSYNNDGAGNFAPEQFGSTGYVGDLPHRLRQVIANQGLRYPLANRNSGLVQAGGNLNVSGGPVAADMGDFDGDGIPDVAVVLADAREILILRQTGISSAQALASFPIGYEGADVIVRDFNGDGLNDIVVSSGESGWLTPVLNLGGGQFNKLGDFAVGGNPGELSTGDFDGDGDMDLAAVAHGSGMQNRVYVYFNQAFPYVTGQAPGPSLALANAPVSLRWSEAMSNGAATPNGLFVWGSQSGAHHLASGATFSGGGTDSIAFQSNIPFLPGEQISVSTTLGVTSLGGTSPPFNHNFNFSVASAPGNCLFNFAGDVPVSQSPECGVVADFDGDGRTDLATTGTEVSIRLAGGCGQFVAFQDSLVTQNPAEMIAADFNLDGHPDVFVYKKTSGTSAGGSVLLNDGTGKLTVGQPLNTVGSYAAAVADFDGNGTPDVAVNDYANNVRFFWNDGTGNFAIPQSADLVFGGEPAEMKAVDIDRDGDMDLVLADQVNNRIMTILNTRHFVTSFRRVFSTPLPFGPTDIELADFDQDGHMDAVSSLQTGMITVQFGNSSGLFSGGYTLTGMPSSEKVLAGDYNGDGSPDIAVLMPSVDSIRVYLNDGSGQLAYLRSLATDSDPVDLLTGDLTGDGRLDLAVVDKIQSRIKIYANELTSTSLTGSGQMAYAPALNPSQAISFDFSVSPSTAYIGDNFSVMGQMSGFRNGTYSTSGNTATFTPASPYFPGEKLYVSLSGCFSGNSSGLDRGHAFEFYVATGLANGNFMELPDVSVSSPFISGFAPADYDGDGEIELALIASRQSFTGRDTLILFENNGTGIMAPTTKFELGFNVFDIQAIDQNQDGYPDLVSGAGGDGMFVFTNNGSGGFGQPDYYGVNTRLFGISVADLEGDGDADIVLAENDFSSGGSTSNNVFYNNDQGSFVPITAPASDFAVDVQTADIDGDHWIDALRMISASQEFRIYLNDQNGYPQSGGSGYQGPFGHGMRTADFNQDGFPDLAVSQHDSSHVYILFNDQLGNFSNPQTLSVPEPNELTHGDFDGDGDLDLAVTSESMQGVALLWNNGAGQMAAPVWVSTSYSLDQIEAADFDGDNRLDLVVSRTNNPGGFNILLNEALIGLEDEGPGHELMILPNPSQGGAWGLLPQEKAERPVELKVMDLQGKTLFSGMTASGQLKFKLPDLGRGLFLVQASQGNWQQTTKWVCQ